MMSVGRKMGPPWASHVLHRLIFGKHEKVFFSEITRHRAFILGMLHHLVVLQIFSDYQVCSNYAPGAKNGHATEVTFLVCKGDNTVIFFSIVNNSFLP